MDNKIKKSLLAFLTIGVLFASCKKNLEEYNPSGLTASTVYTQAAGFETLVNAAYSYSRFWYGKEEGYSISEMGTDIWTNGTGDVFPNCQLIITCRVAILLRWHWSGIIFMPLLIYVTPASRPYLK